MFECVWRALASWSFGDRIRSSPRQGRLLRLPVGACVRVGGEPAQVAARRELTSPEGGQPAVAYTCRGIAEDWQLVVRPVGDDGVDVRLFGVDVCRRVCPDDVEVYE